MSNPNINVVLVNEDGQYKEGNGKIERIGNTRGKWVRWHIRNQTFTPIHVKIHRFSPGPCPFENGDFVGCVYDSRANGDPPIPAAPPPGNSRTISGKLDRNGSGLYTYELFVSHHATGVGNAVDPELQIDDPPLHPLKWILATVGLLGALAFMYRWFRS